MASFIYPLQIFIDILFGLFIHLLYIFIVTIGCPGVLRIIAFVEGETIKWLQPEIGLLHRGTEKLIEYRNINITIPYFHRLDYVSLLAQEEIYAYGLEKVFNLRISNLASVIRTVFLEISRIFNHLLAITTHAIDIGAFTPFLWAFEEREKVIEFYESMTGNRMHTSYITIGGVIIDIPLYWLDQIYKWFHIFPIKLQEIHTVLSYNRLFKIRLSNIAILTTNIIECYAITGVSMRASREINKKDLRLIGYEY